MELVRRVHSMKEVCRQAQAHGRRIGFVPTMGALHAGHLSLIRRSRELTDLVVVSIFVNPAQFDDAEDLARYPRDLAADADLCIAEGVDYVFAPPPEELYPPGSRTVVEVPGLSARLEGRSRPGHFRGVATVVLKLLAIVRPDVAAFGQKDAQQAAVVQRMVSDLMLDVELLVLPTVRDDDGLALSSRNARLDPGSREAARAIPRALEAARRALADGQQSAEKLCSLVHEVLQADPRVEVDYVELVDRSELEPRLEVGGDALLLVAVRVGGVRLIDNAILRA